jgi:septal ring factor EnvC (AmiA/AmiB activator)
MSNRRGLSDLIKEEADKPAAAAAGNEAGGNQNADLAEKDKTIAKLEKELEKAKSDLEEAQKEVLRLINENKQAKAQNQSGGSAKAIAASRAPSSGQMVAASGLQIAHAHKRDNVIIPDMVVNQNAENNPDFAVNTWLL